MEKCITCPVRGRLANLRCEVNPETSRIVGAIRCSLIEGEVDCEQECVKRLNLAIGETQPVGT